MRAAASKRVALNALRYMASDWVMRSRAGIWDSGAGFGYAWCSLAMIAGIPDCQLPSTVGPPRREHMPAFERYSEGCSS
jgi:hypothetical protein